jgi:hypothetical protein
MLTRRDYGGGVRVDMLRRWRCVGASHDVCGPVVAAVAHCVGTSHDVGRGLTEAEPEPA